MNALINIYKNHSINSTSSLLRQIYFGVCIEITASTYVARLSLALSVLIVTSSLRVFFFFFNLRCDCRPLNIRFFYWLNVCSESLKERWHVMIFTMNTDNPRPPPLWTFFLKKKTPHPSLQLPCPFTWTCSCICDVKNKTFSLSGSFFSPHSHTLHCFTQTPGEHWEHFVSGMKSHGFENTNSVILNSFPWFLWIEDSPASLC